MKGGQHRAPDHLRQVIAERMSRDGTPRTVDEIAEMVEEDPQRVRYGILVLEQAGKLRRVLGADAIRYETTA